jgi:hypothetical protein
MENRYMCGPNYSSECYVLLLLDVRVVYQWDIAQGGGRRRKKEKERERERESRVGQYPRI